MSPLSPNSQYTIKGKQLSIDITIFIIHSFSKTPAPQNGTLLESLKCNDYITCCLDRFWWLALIEVVNKEEKDLTCKFHHPHGPSGQFTGLVVMIEGTYPETRSWRTFRLLLRQQMKEHISSLNRKITKSGITSREQVFRWWNFIFLFFIDFWRIFHDATHQIFKILLASVSFLLMLRDRYALLQPIFDTVACQLVKGWYRLFDTGIMILGTLIWACTQI